MHGGGPAVVAGNPLPEEYTSENLELVRKGVCNMEHHIRNAIKFGVPVVVALNKFTADTQGEIDIVIESAKSAGAYDAVLANHWAEGGEGAKKLASAVKNACKSAKREDFKFLYPLDLPIKEKIQVHRKHTHIQREVSSRLMLLTTHPILFFFSLFLLFSDYRS